MYSSRLAVAFGGASEAVSARRFLLAFSSSNRRFFSSNAAARCDLASSAILIATELQSYTIQHKYATQRNDHTLYRPHRVA